MRDKVSQLIKRRIAQSAVLLFCFSLGLSQAKVERSILRDVSQRETVPDFIVRLKNSPGTVTSLNPNADDSFRDHSLASKIRWDTLDVSKDTTGVDAGTATRDTESTRKSPGLAILMSAVIPGSGQIYVHRYITIPLIWGFGYYFATAWNEQNNRYIYYRDLFSASVQADSLHQGNGNYQSYRDLYRDDRDKFAFYLAITYILNIVDAYVGASLYSFDVSDNLGGSAAIRFRIPIQ
jgi:hypothetical protein